MTMEDPIQTHSTYRQHGNKKKLVDSHNGNRYFQKLGTVWRLILNIGFFILMNLTTVAQSEACWVNRKEVVVRNHVLLYLYSRDAVMQLVEARHF
jgi:hypothetical protein